jgi:uncharacterized protein YndB with AHSA1/START domain
MLQVCPTDLVNAPAEQVWKLLTIPQELAEWTKTTIIESPGHELRAGDRLVLGAAIGMKVIFEVQDAIRPNRLALRILLPFGVTNNEVMQITPASSDQCRVTFN